MASAIGIYIISLWLDTGGGGDKQCRWVPGCLGACCYLNGWAERGKEGQGVVCPEPQPALWWGVVERVGGFSGSPVPSHCLISAPRTRLF